MTTTILRDVEGAKPIMMVLAKMREVKGITQQQMAKKVGVSQAVISKLEHKQDRLVNVGVMCKYAKALGLDIAVRLIKKKVK